MNEINSFISDFLKELRNNNVAIFAGAGLSVAAGCVNWKELMRPVAQELELDIDKEENLISIAQYHCNEHGGNRGQLNKLLIEEYSMAHEITENHKILARLPISTFWTTNYDKLIEKSLEETSKVPDVKYTVKQLAFTKPKRDAVVYKMHGDIDHPNEAILTKDDYESYHIKMAPFVTALSGDLVSKTFLFVGFSFTDPNLDYIFSRIRITYTTDLRRHYCFLKKVDRQSYSNDENYKYAELKQEFFIKDLKRFNIKVVLLNKYSEITDILKTLENRYKRKTVFVSGSAVEYGGDAGEYTKFIYELGKRLIREGYNVVSGFGVGVGNYVIGGCLEEIYSDRKKYSDDQLILRPFPQETRLRKNYRQDMISYAGIAIFLFGNKESGARVVLAEGVRKEFNIASEKKLKLVPIGNTEYIAKELWQKVFNNISEYYPAQSQNETFKNLFERLGNSTFQLSENIELIVEVLKFISEE
ncbi:MAG: SIR2 family protein [Blastocatellia bacterium]